MKTATKRADELKAAFKKAAKEFKPQPLEPVPPLDALVRKGLALRTFDVSPSVRSSRHQAWRPLRRSPRSTRSHSPCSRGSRMRPIRAS